MARRDDGNEPIKARPPRSVGSRERELAEFGVSPAPIPDQIDIEVPLSPQSPGVTKPVSEIDFSFIPDVCTTGMQPADITSAILRLLQGHFGSTSTIRNPELRELVWSNSSDAKILISSSTYVRQPEANKKPRIIVKRGVQRSQRVAVGDRGKFTNVDPHTSKSSYSRWSSGISRIAVIGESGHLTDLLTEEVYLGLTFLAPKVVAQTAFYDFQVVALSGIEPLSNVGDEFMGAVDVSYVYETAWVTTDITSTLQVLQDTVRTVK
jgi:hypothetical protein